MKNLIRLSILGIFALPLMMTGCTCSEQKEEVPPMEETVDEVPMEGMDEGSMMEEGVPEEMPSEDDGHGH